MECFRDNCNLKSFIKHPTCYKNPDSPICIDLVLTNASGSFQSICVLETGLSDFHSMILTVMRNTFKKLQPRIISYRSCKNLSNEKFKSCLLNELRKEDFVNNNKSFKRYCKLSIKVLNKYAQQKKKFARRNEMPFMRKDLANT